MYFRKTKLFSLLLTLKSFCAMNEHGTKKSFSFKFSLVNVTPLVYNCEYVQDYATISMNRNHIYNSLAYA